MKKMFLISFLFLIVGSAFAEEFYSKASVENVIKTEFDNDSQAYVLAMSQIVKEEKANSNTIFKAYASAFDLVGYINSNDINKSLGNLEKLQSIIVKSFTPAAKMYRSLYTNDKEYFKQYKENLTKFKELIKIAKKDYSDKETWGEIIRLAALLNWIPKRNAGFQFEKCDWTIDEYNWMKNRLVSN